MKGVSLIYHVHDFDRLERSTLKVSLAWSEDLIVFSIGIFDYFIHLAVFKGF